ncbi:efflux RND transporter periplasmic adaptor subunit [Pseudodesulfovibrio sp. zrk46]|uniref:efflux RND transporter periplasmic adaptor subunit n=1 Tax=Pseudodesulfovibrio sp. zrk46 TaxID=2725288 RepID=UPI00144A1305|nr:efflux RND transporter periplasmic adaptor subunit [Pseudodesulfovibrio sp. zrk46]QJB55704.1 efflux RND transporter periplasmic adaptor subunit [Pseudodesulfovibrio sp. zrk46]
MNRRTCVSLLLLLVVTMLAACGSEPLPTVEKRGAYTPESTVVAELAELPRLHEAVGTVKARTDIRVEAQVTGRVLKVMVRPGDKVAAGQELLILDSRASKTRLERSKQASQSAASMVARAKDGLSGAKADFDKMESTYRRMKQLHDQKVVTAEEVEQAESAYLQAQSRLGQAKQGLAAVQAQAREASEVVQEAEIGLGYTVITAQEDGEVARRLAEPGDLAFPGKELLTLQTGASLRLEAMVRESLIGRVRIGDMLGVVVTALGGDEPISGVVDEIEPLADPVTRSFLVKVRLPEVPGLYPGMFGRLEVPLGERQSVLIPEAAVTRVGQLETVMVKTDSGWESAYVRSGESHGDKVEVLSGLSGGETVGIGMKAEAE